MIKPRYKRPQTEMENAEDRLSQFSAACLRISKSLDLGTVLQDVIDSACSLTGARYGALITFDEPGGVGNITTSGTTPQEHLELGELPKGLGILEYLSEMDEPLRLTDIASHPRSVGFPRNHPPMNTFLGSPVRYQGERLGNIYLTEKEGGREFSQEDEEILALFAAQAAPVIANACRYRQDMQARADLEALINISPVGVVVFDAKTRDLISVNDETRRIFGKLNAPGRNLAHLLEVMTPRTPDGRRIPFDELPTSKALRTGETVLAHEVVMHLPGARVVNTLVNARPIVREDGAVGSVVVTIQDITPLEEMKRQRTEFLSRIGHKLRTPLTSIKGSVTSMLDPSRPPDVTEGRQFLQIIDEQAGRMRSLINDFVDMTLIESGALLVTLEATDLKALVDEVREAFLLEGTGHDIELDLAPDLPRVMADGRRIFQALGSCIRHVSERSPEFSTIRVSASLEDRHVAVSVQTENGDFSTEGSPRRLEKFASADGKDPVSSEKEDDLSLLVCKGIVEANGGRISAELGGPGRGARFIFTIPVFVETEGEDANDPVQHDEPSGKSGRDQGRILVVDGDAETRTYIRNTLWEAGFAPVATGDPDEVDKLIEEQKPHLILLEPLLPRTEEFELMVRIRNTYDAPVVIMSASGHSGYMERGFELGATDYIVKPFTQTELLARIKAALRRRQGSMADEFPEPFILGDLTIDYAKHLVTVAGRQVRLTATEYRLLFELSVAAGRILTHEQLLRLVWGPLYSGDVRLVHTYIKQLRNKLRDDARRPTYILTEPRVGYRIAR